MSASLSSIYVIYVLCDQCDVGYVMHPQLHETRMSLIITFGEIWISCSYIRVYIVYMYTRTWRDTLACSAFLETSARLYGEIRPCTISPEALSI
jgi:hypothetical protein